MAELAAVNKIEKIRSLPDFDSSLVENFGTLDNYATATLSNIGCRSGTVTGNVNETASLL